MTTSRMFPRGSHALKPARAPSGTTHSQLPEASLPFLWPRARRYGIAHRRLHDLGDPRHDRPIDLILRQSKHRCPACRRCFLADVSDLALPKSRYTLRVQRTAVRLVVEDGLPYRAAGWHLWRDHRVFVPWPTIQNWVEAAGEKN